MQPLGLSKAELAIYRRHIFSSHEFTVELDVLDQDGTIIDSIRPTLLDGQVNITRGDGVLRTATFTTYDPDHSLGLDADSPWDGAVFADRQIRARHTTLVPELAAFVTAVPFVGPTVKIARDGDVLSLECQDRSSLAMQPCPPLTVGKGMNCVEAIKKIMRQRTGETRFRLPANNKARLGKALNVGWSEEATPWKVCKKIAAQLGMQLFYSCDGYLTLRRLPSDPAITITEAQLTSRVAVDYDLTETKNHVRVSGNVAPKKKGGKADPVTRTATVAPSHPMRPSKIGREDVSRYLPLLITGETFKKASAAQALADLELRRNQSMSVGTTLNCVPFFDGDVGDLVEVATAAGMTNIRLDDGSIPLGASGDMSIGYQKSVSKAGVKR